MARTPKPWFYAKLRAWYVNIGGVRHRLGATKKEADREFYRLMAGREEGGPEAARALLVADAVERFLAENAHQRANTQVMHHRMLEPFARRFQTRRLDSIRADECLEFVGSYTVTSKKSRGFGDPSRYLMFRNLGTLFRWARDRGLISINPLLRVPSPWTTTPRTRGMTEEEFLRIMQDQVVHDSLKEVLEIIWRTGMRPGEVAALAARHLDAQGDYIRLQPTEYKTGTRTGQQREVVVPHELMERLRRRALLCPRGPLLCNRRGDPWTQHKISTSFGNAKRRLGLDPVVVIHMARHRFMTRLAEGGVPLHRVARLAGHRDTLTAVKHYIHPEAQALQDDIARLDQGMEERLARIHAEVEERRRKGTGAASVT